MSCVFGLTTCLLLERAKAGSVSSGQTPRATQPGRPELALGAGELLTKLGDLRGELGCARARLPTDAAGSRRWLAATRGRRCWWGAVRGSEALDRVADGGFGVEPGAADAGNAGDQVEGERAAVGFEMAQRISGPLQRLLAPAGRPQHAGGRFVSPRVVTGAPCPRSTRSAPCRPGRALVRSVERRCACSGTRRSGLWDR